MSPFKKVIGKHGIQGYTRVVEELVRVLDELSEVKHIKCGDYDKEGARHWHVNITKTKINRQAVLAFRYNQGGYIWFITAADGIAVRHCMETIKAALLSWRPDMLVKTYYPQESQRKNRHRRNKKPGTDHNEKLHPFNKEHLDKEARKALEASRNEIKISSPIEKSNSEIQIPAHGNGNSAAIQKQPSKIFPMVENGSTSLLEVIPPAIKQWSRELAQAAEREDMEHVNCLAVKICQFAGLALQNHHANGAQ